MDNSPSIRQMLVSLGLNRVEATLAVPMMFTAPPASDPDMAGTRAVVKAIQRGLNNLGAHLEEDGYFGAATAAALDKVVLPPQSYCKRPWLDIVKTVKAAEGRIALGDDLPIDRLATDLKPTPDFTPYVVGGAVAAGILWLVFGRH